MSTTVHALTALLRGPHPQHHEEFARLVAGPAFDPGPAGEGAAETAARAYGRLALISRHVHPARNLLGDVHRLTALHEWAALVDGTLFTVMTTHLNLALGSIVQQAADRPELADTVEELEELRAVGVFVATELGYGNNLVTLETRARFDPAAGGFVLTTPSARARKYMPNTCLNGIPKVGVVLARALVDGRDCGVFPFLLRLSDGERPTEGVHLAALPDKPGLALDNAVTSFHDVRLPLAAMLAEERLTLARTGTLDAPLHRKVTRFLGAIESIQGGKLCLAAGSAAMARAATALAVRYAHQRLTFAPGRGQVPLAAYRTHQRALVRCVAASYATTFLVGEAKDALARERSAGDRLSDALVRQIAVTKALTTWTAREVLQTCRERCGAQGLFSLNRIADYLAVNEGAITAEGDNEVIMIKAGRQLLAAATDSAAPDAPGTGLLPLLAAREAVLRERTTAALEADERSGGSVFDAWNAGVGAVRDLATAHGRARALAATTRAAAACADPLGLELLGLLAESWALDDLAEHTGWYLGAKLLDAEQAAGLDARQGAVTARLAPHLPLLAEAFALPDQVLRSPLASPDYLRAVEDWVRTTPGAREAR
ncbi:MULTISPECIES: acyl-CoA dehydrogenase [Kitasatospora]|uniref:Putative acyl-CoA oxidase n=1 Tax=Kitasatospora setae (strain ATCC 33774 / DSM 43861 / JCM 3304 / KCC A-0304 / NBRC 14216 / KM-6054) TaxID=452652 RepID=E4N3U8_KITSK|nr:MULTISPECIES: acyl-CoA dehydrogenase [Kitasatospora]BAJ31579.1 putative acyl-CoA oxidase [Kitasatospora setae KM-6054]